MLRLVSLVKLWIRARVMHRCSHQLIHFIRFLFNSVPCKNPNEKNTLFGEHKSYRYQTIAVTLQKDLAKEKKRSSLENKTIQKIENSDDTLESVILCSREANVVRKSHFSACNKVSMPLWEWERERRENKINYYIKWQHLHQIFRMKCICVQKSARLL